MNQILINVLAQDPSCTPGICLSLRWFLPFIPHLENMFGWFVLPLLGTWLGYFFVDTNDLWDQMFSFTGLLYIGLLVSMLPKINTSSKLWFDANLFTVICYLVYFAELKIVDCYNMELEYSISWLFDIGFSTTLILIFYGILLCCRLSTPRYFRTIVSIYILSDLGNLIALVILNLHCLAKMFISVCLMIIIYHFLTKRPSLPNRKEAIIPTFWNNNLLIFKCIFWGTMVVWIDYMALTPFYILESIATSESHHRKDSLLYYCKKQWEAHKSSFLESIKGAGQSVGVRLSIYKTYT